MSSDGYFSDVDDDVLVHLDAIEADALRSLDPKTSHVLPRCPTPDSEPSMTFSDFDATFDIDESELVKLDEIIEQQYGGMDGCKGEGSSNSEGASPDMPCRGPSMTLRDASLSWLIEDDDEMDIHLVVSDDDEEQSGCGYTKHVKFMSPEPLSSPLLQRSHFRRSNKGKQVILPSSPEREEPPTAWNGNEPPEPTFPVQVRSRKRTIALTDLSSPGHDKGDSSPLLFRRIQRGERNDPSVTSPTIPQPPSKRRRLQHHNTTSPSPSRNQARRNIRSRLNTGHHIYDIEAEHSGDEVSEGSSHASDEFERSSDRDFVQELPETQVSPSYDQSLMYRQSLLSQAPPGFFDRVKDAPLFAKRPTRRGAFGVRDGVQHHRPILVSSSSPRQDDDLDEYEMDDFVVPDEDL